MPCCSSRLLFAALFALTLGGCGSGEPPPLPEPAPQQPAPAGDIEDEIFPHVSAQMPAEGLESDGRIAPWALGAQVGATLHALTEACGRHDPAALRRMQQDQRDATLGEGVDADRFDAVWNWAYRQARQKITLQPPPDLKRGCARLHEMQQDEDRMEQMMRPVALP